jgi:predicted SAM-dependent methyltransferase
VLKINCGAGRDIQTESDGWLNLDARPLPDIDVVIDLEVNNLPFGDCTADTIWLRDFLEHLSEKRQVPFLQDVRRVLIEGGSLFIQLPDLEVLAKRYCDVLENPTDIQPPIDAVHLAKSLYGAEDCPENKHKWGYDQHSLRVALEDLGFVIQSVHSDGGQNLLCYAVKGG